MSSQVKVEDFEVFRVFRVALLKFAQAVDQSLSGAESQIGRTHSWLENEQASFWQGQLRKRTEAVTKARDAVRQKKLYKDASGHSPSAVEEEKTLARCIAAVAEAEHKIEAVRKWLPRMEKAADAYRGGVSRLNLAVSADIPKAIALLDRLAGTLEQYVQIENQAGDMPESAHATEEVPMTTGGDTTPAPPPKTAEAPPAATAGNPAALATPQPPASKEGRHVADGQ